MQLRCNHLHGNNKIVTSYASARSQEDIIELARCHSMNNLLVINTFIHRHKEIYYPFFMYIKSKLCFTTNRA